MFGIGLWRNHCAKHICVTSKKKNRVCNKVFPAVRDFVERNIASLLLEIEKVNFKTSASGEFFGMSSSRV
jgi:hypothetical protein